MATAAHRPSLPFRTSAAGPASPGARLLWFHRKSPVSEIASSDCEFKSLSTNYWLCSSASSSTSSLVPENSYFISQSHSFSVCEIVLLREFPGGLVVRIPGFHCRGLGSIPGRGTESPSCKPRRAAEKKNSAVDTYFGGCWEDSKYLRQIGVTQYLILSWVNGKLICCC